MLTAPAIPSRGGHQSVLALILLFALVIRLAWALSRPISDAALNQLPDQHDYLSLARSVLHGDGFVFRDPRFPDELKAFRTPGYPIFLALSGANARAARVAQALIDTSTILAIYCIAKRLIVSRNVRAVALIAAMIVAVNPFLVYFSGLLLTETLFTAMLAWAMLLLVCASQPGKWMKVQWLIAGLLLTVSILIRPSGIALPVMLAVTGVCVMPRTRQRIIHVTAESSATSPNQNMLTPGAYQTSWTARAGIAATAILQLTLLTLLPWAIRNHSVLGRWIPLDTNSGFTLYDGFNPAATGASDQTFVKRMPQLLSMNELQRSDYLGKRARVYAIQNPGRVVSLAFTKLARTWSPITLSSEFGQLRYQIIAAAYAIPFDLFVLIGLLTCGLSRGTKAFLLTPAVYFSIVHALTVGSLRYRVPAEPPLAILAAAALVKAAEKMRTRSTLTIQTSETSQ